YSKNTSAPVQAEPKKRQRAPSEDAAHRTASLQRSPGIPNLSGYNDETRRTIELACVSERMNGPVAYGACLNRQMASLQGSPGIPNLSGHNDETRRTIELACVSERMNGPVAYGACLNRQMASL